MIVKVFQKNKNGKIELSLEELEQILNETYWDGYRSNNYYVYKTPSTGSTPNWYWWNSPYYTTTSDSEVTLNKNNFDTKTACDCH